MFDDVFNRMQHLAGDALVSVPTGDEIFVSTDVLMAALTNGGQERTAQEFAALGAEVGLRLTRTFPLASGDVAHELRRSR